MQRRNEEEEEDFLILKLEETRKKFFFIFLKSQWKKISPVKNSQSTGFFCYVTKTLSITQIGEQEIKSKKTISHSFLFYSLKLKNQF